VEPAAVGHHIMEGECPSLAVAIRDRVATVTLSRPQRHNALDLPMIRAIRGAIRSLAAQHSIRAVVLHGDGPSFCSGLDFPSFMVDGELQIDMLLAREPDTDCNLAQSIAVSWSELPVPVIAAVHGVAFGAGFQLALGADVRICSPDARLSLLEARWGLLPDMGVTLFLPRLVGIDVAKELTFSGRVIDGTEAVSLGLATRLSDDPLALAHRIAREWSTRSPDAVRRAKRLWDASWTMARAQSLLLEEHLQRELFGTPNQLEALRAGLANETPEFHDPL